MFINTNTTMILNRWKLLYHGSLNGTIEGVPQGTVLAPLLILIFINHIVKDLNSTVKLYADNILIYATIGSPEDCLLT